MNENTLTIRCCESSSTIEINVNGVDGVGGVIGLASNGRLSLLKIASFQEI